MIPETFEKQFFDYLHRLSGKRKLANLADLEKLTSEDLLTLANKINPSLLPLFVHILKSSKTNMFQRLMGDHEPDHKPLVDAFFNKYSEEILSEESKINDFNPLVTYLPPEVFNDLAFIQSRELFFKRQRADVINEYFAATFGENTEFQAGQTEQAWNYFWDRLLKL